MFSEETKDRAYFMPGALTLRAPAGGALTCQRPADLALDMTIPGIARAFEVVKKIVHIGYIPLVLYIGALHCLLQNSRAGLVMILLGAAVLVQHPY